MSNHNNNHLHKFYQLSPQERLQRVRVLAELSHEDAAAIQKTGGLSLEQADHMSENVIGTMELPLGLGVHFLINQKEYLVPMVLEESSVVAAASKMAKMTRARGGFVTRSTKPIMIGQIQILNIADPFSAKENILAHRDEILQLANQQCPLLVQLGGGAEGLEVRVLDTQSGPMVICHLLVNCKDAMGANMVNTMSEAIADTLEKISGGRVCLRIISNLAVHRTARAEAVFDKNELGGDTVVDAMLAAYHFAEADPFRATTHNKGIMNGVIAVALATGQDTRAIEAGAHAYASLQGHYHSLSTWSKDVNGDLVGSLELPMAVGCVGGITSVHPIVRANLHVLGVKTGQELAEVMVAVGLAQNAAAMRALGTEGIQKGHMKLHARNLALMAGAPPEMVDIVVARLAERGTIRLEDAQKVMEELNSVENRYSSLNHTMESPGL